MEKIELFSLLAFMTSLLSLVLVIILLLRSRHSDTVALSREMQHNHEETTAQISDVRRELMASTQNSLQQFAQSLNAAQQQTAAVQDKRLAELISSDNDKQLLLRQSMEERLLQMKTTLAESVTAMQQSLERSMTLLATAQQGQFSLQDKRMDEQNRTQAEKQDLLRQELTAQLKAMEARLQSFTQQSTEALETVRSTVQSRLEAMREDNEKQLDKMRMTVDEKLQKTLDDRITQSFQLVNQRLQEVYTGLGEMKTLAGGVGDLKKVLSNVKTRGIMGELQLGAIMEELLPHEQYEENIVTKPGSAERVEFAIKLPGDGDEPVYMPIDAKFPADTYTHLLDAYDTGDSAQVEAAYAALETRIRGCAKDIHDKYIDPPHTTDFAILFLPFEGLYAEVVRRGLIDELQRKYKVNIAGPTTFAALLNSLQMGFRTLAIQKRSGEVWKILGAVKTEFTNFGDVLQKAQQRIEQTGAELDKLVGVRTRKINSTLRNVYELNDTESQRLLENASDEP